MTPQQVKNALAAILSLVLIGAGAFAVWKYNTAVTKAAQYETLADRVTLLETQQRIVAEEVARRAAGDTTIRASRAATSQRLEHIADEDPAARAYLDERIPRSVRDAYLAR